MKAVSFYLSGCFTVNEQVEESPMSNKHIGRAMTTASQPTMKLLAQHQKEFIVPDDNSKKKFILLEDDTTIHVENKTSMEAHTSESERKSEKTINFESLSKHFGRPLDDAAASFGGISYFLFYKLIALLYFGFICKNLTNAEL